jgi:hypothetical protein
MSSQLEDPNSLLIDANTGVALFNGKTYDRPCTLDGMFTCPISLELFKRIDFSEIRRVSTITNGTYLAVEPAGWNTVFFRVVA